MLNTCLSVCSSVSCSQSEALGIHGILNSAYVDMYNATNNSWSRFPNGLGLGRHGLAAASLTSGLVFFAGGYGVTMKMAACVRCCEMMLLLCTPEVCIVLTHAFQATENRPTWTFTTHQATAGSIPFIRSRFG